MNRKGKGISAERELIHKLWNAGWPAFRAAGSGAIKYPCPDIIAGRGTRKLAIEVKSTGGETQYISTETVQSLQAFAHQFGAEAWFAIRFRGGEWYFVTPDDLARTPGQFSAPKERLEQTGLRFEELIRIS